MASIPTWNRTASAFEPDRRRHAAPAAIPKGCAYNPRCPKTFDRCMTDRPDLMSAGNTRAACWLHAGATTKVRR